MLDSLELLPTEIGHPHFFQNVTSFCCWRKLLAGVEVLVSAEFVAPFSKEVSCTVGFSLDVSALKKFTLSGEVLKIRHCLHQLPGRLVGGGDPCCNQFRIYL